MGGIKLPPPPPQIRVKQLLHCKILSQNTFSTQTLFEDVGNIKLVFVKIFVLLFSISISLPRMEFLKNK